MFSANDPVTVKGLDVPLVDKAIEGLEATVYELIGNLLKGAVNVKDTVVALVIVAVPTVGTPGALLAPEPCAPRIGIGLFYLTSIFASI